MNFLIPLAVMTESPWLALAPAILFLVLFGRSRSRTALVVVILWLGYCCYEYAMKLRILCPGECNIRVDLVLIYPFLIISSLIGMAVFVWTLRSNA